jgi:tetratricopeptide (TPR) repeat protein
MKATACTLFSAAALLWGASLAAQAPQQPSQPAQTLQSPAMQLVSEGRKLNNEGKQQEALDAFRKAIQMEPSLVDAHLAAGSTLDLMGQYDEARQEFAKAIEVAPPQRKVQALRAMGVSYAFTRQPKEAAKYDQQAFDIQLGQKRYFDAGEVANELARIYIESGDLNDAYKWYDKGCKTGLSNPDIKDAEKDLWNFRWEHALARIAARRGNKAETEKHVAAAKAVLDKGTNPEQARFFPYLTGYVALYTGDPKTAIADLQKADQRDPFIQLLLAQAYEKTGDKAAALDAYRKIMAVNAHNPTNAFARPVAKKKLGLK